MELTYILNYAVFAAFFCLFIIATGIGILTLIDYEKYREGIRRYLLPTWSIDGTFAVFYIINFVASYPGLVGTIYIYIVPVLVASVFFLLRSAFIAYSEYIGEIEDEKEYMKVYGVATVLTAFFVISILSSGVSGIGVNLQTNSISLFTIFVNPFNILLFLSAATVASFTAVNYFKVKVLDAASYLFLPVAFILAVLAIYLYVPYMFGAITQNYYLPLISIALMAITLLLKKLHNKAASFMGIFWFFVSIMLFGMAQYPYLFGGQESFLNYLNNSTTGADVTLVTFVGGALLIIALLFFLYIDFIKKDVK